MNERIRSYFILGCIVVLVGYPLLWLTRCVYYMYVDSQSIAGSNQAIMRVKHLGIIMDGNRRWSKSRGCKNDIGYREGAERLWEIACLCIEEGVEHLTAYALSLDNVRRRSEEELNQLLNMGVSILETRKEWAIKQGIRIHFIGDTSVMPPDIIQRIRSLEEETKDCAELIIHLLFCYDPIDDCTTAARRIAEQVSNGTLKTSQITDQLFKNNLRSGDIPSIDVVVRTGGCERLSGFLPLQSVYSELVFMPYMWPDIRKSDVRKIIRNFYMRTRNFGK